MAVVYNDTVKTSRMTNVLNAIDGGAGAGKLVIRNSSNTTLVSIPLADPSGTVATPVAGTVELQFDVSPALSGTATATGTAANAIITDSADTVIASGLTVGTSGTDVILNSTSITSGQVVTISAAKITHG